MVGRLHSGMMYGGVDYEFKVSESTDYIKGGVFKQKHIKQGHLSIN